MGAFLCHVCNNMCQFGQIKNFLPLQKHFTLRHNEVVKPLGLACLPLSPMDFASERGQGQGFKIFAPLFPICYIPHVLR